MHYHTPTQWILFFFFYCFLGWMWECSYVSIKEGIEHKEFKFINRGFLHGPIIPIYGFAAVSILMATMPIRDNYLAVYFIGAVTATLFELITGSTMERLFRVKYWDYSVFPLNFKGYICIFVSAFWGLAALFLTTVIHVPAEDLICGMPQWLAEFAAFALVAAGAYDFNSSLNEVLDLRAVLSDVASDNLAAVKRFEKRIDATVAFSPLFNRDYAAKLLRRNPTIVSNRYNEAMKVIKELLRK